MPACHSTTHWGACKRPSSLSPLGLLLSLQPTIASILAAFCPCLENLKPIFACVPASHMDARLELMLVLHKIQLVASIRHAHIHSPASNNTLTFFFCRHGSVSFFLSDRFVASHLRPMLCRPAPRIKAAMLTINGALLDSWTYHFADRTRAAVKPDSAASEHHVGACSRPGYMLLHSTTYGYQ
jgi:hypothetical protein